MKSTLRRRGGLNAVRVIVLAATMLMGVVGSIDRDHVHGYERHLQDTDIVGVTFGSGQDMSSGAESSTAFTSAGDVETELVEALEADEHVAVVSAVRLGEMNCDSLAGVEDALFLRVAVNANETLIAERTTFTVMDGNTFTDGNNRKLWTGEVVDEVDASTKTVSIAWGEDCKAETFLQTVTTYNTDGSISVLETVPCDAGSSTDICVVEVHLDLPEEDEPIVQSPDGLSSTDDESARRLQVTHESRAGAVTNGPSAKARELQRAPTVISVMCLYSEGARKYKAGITPEQMETYLATQYAITNEAAINSDVDLQFSLVHVGPLPYDEDTTSASTSLQALKASEAVADLRCKYAADLVQVVGYYGISCGIGYKFNGRASSAFSAASPYCFFQFTHTHELAHNLGCMHNREVLSSGFTQHSHGHRYCSGTPTYRTIMSYNCNKHVKRVNYFSNPDVSYLNKATGTATENNALTIKENMVAVSSFYPTASCPGLTADSNRDLVDARERTKVKTKTKSYDTRTSVDGGCDPKGCKAALARDSSRDGNSRWSCRRELTGKACKLINKFKDAPQDILSLRLAFHRGDEQTRRFQVQTVDSAGKKDKHKFTSSGTTLDFQDFDLNSRSTTRLIIKPISPNKDDWFEITEEMIMVA